MGDVFGEELEHFCASRDCCKDRAGCIQQMHGLIDSEMGPAQWCAQRWTGLGDCIVVILSRALCHGIFSIVVISRFEVDKKKSWSAVISELNALKNIGADSDGDAAGGEAPHAPEQLFDLPDPVQDDTYVAKQTAFRENGSVFIRSKPDGRLTIFRIIYNIQAVAIRTRIKDASAL